MKKFREELEERTSSIAVVTLATVHSDCGIKLRSPIFIKVSKLLNITVHMETYISYLI